MIGCVVSALAGLLLLAAPGWAADYRNLPADQALTLVRQTPDLYLLDVRTPAEYRQVRLAGAVLIPIEEFVARQAEVPRDQPILVYCAVGSRSSQVAGYLAARGFSQVNNLVGGIWGWQLRHYPVLTGPP